jgi:hypothetical protein
MLVGKGMSLVTIHVQGNVSHDILKYICNAWVIDIEYS